MSGIDVSPVTPDDALAFITLYRFYWYDFTEFTDEDVDADGRFDDHFAEAYLTKPLHTAYLFRVEGHPAGLAVVRSCDAVDGSGTVTDMEQFFVMRKYRRHGAGEAAAHWLFDRYPGRWQVRERANNLPAHAFWRAIIGRYTAGQFTELSSESSPTGGPVQFFEAPHTDPGT